MVGNPVLGFLEAQPVGDDARSTVTKMLRWLGIAVLVGFVFNLLNAVLTIAMGSTYAGSTALATTTAIAGLLFALVITAAALFWITYTIRAWSTGNPSGSTHALIIGILAAVFGGLGVLGGLVGGMVGTALFGSGLPVLYVVVNAIGLLVSAAECFCGIMILVNRGKAVNPATTGTPANN